MASERFQKDVKDILRAHYEEITKLQSSALVFEMLLSGVMTGLQDSALSKGDLETIFEKAEDVATTLSLQPGVKSKVFALAIDKLDDLRQHVMKHR
jgi:hypothetical protein